MPQWSILWALVAMVEPGPQWSILWALVVGLLQIVRVQGAAGVAPGRGEVLVRVAPFEAASTALQNRGQRNPCVH